jgi:D-glycero-alpha-D-manno-heptose-7-phosphate kinase
MTELAKNLKDSLSAGTLQDVGPILDEGWKLKKDLSLKISDDKIDSYYNVARENGAAGGKLLGAGGGGFLMFYCERTHQDKLRKSLKDLKEYKFKFDSLGTKVIYDLGNEVS